MTRTNIRYKKKQKTTKLRVKKGGSLAPPPIGTATERQKSFPEASRWFDGGVDTNIANPLSSDPVLVPGYIDTPPRYPYPQLQNTHMPTREHITPDRLTTSSENTAAYGENYIESSMDSSNQPRKNTYEDGPHAFTESGIRVGGSYNDADALMKKMNTLEAKLEAIREMNKRILILLGSQNTRRL